MVTTFWMLLTLTLSIIFMPLVYGASNPHIQALDAFRKSLLDPKNVLRSWDTSLDNPCTWRYILCNTANETIEVNLSFTDLSGHMVPELGQLSSLQRFLITSNTITGTIPPELGNLKELVELDLGWNQISGNIPPSLGSMTSLTMLRLGNNKLSGKIPSELTKLSIARNVYLSNNADLCWDFPPTKVFVGDVLPNVPQEVEDGRID